MSLFVIYERDTFTSLMVSLISLATFCASLMNFTPSFSSLILCRSLVSYLCFYRLLLLLLLYVYKLCVETLKRSYARSSAKPTFLCFFFSSLCKSNGHHFFSAQVHLGQLFWLWASPSMSLLSLQIQKHKSLSS